MYVRSGCEHCYYAMVDGRGTVVKQDRFRTTREELEEFASALPEEGQPVVIEASASAVSSSLSRQLDEQGVAVHQARPTMVRPFAKQQVKTDKVVAMRSCEHNTAGWAISRRAPWPVRQ